MAWLNINNQRGGFFSFCKPVKPVKLKIFKSDGYAYSSVYESLDFLQTHNPVSDEICLSLDELCNSRKDALLKFSVHEAETDKEINAV